MTNETQTKEPTIAEKITTAQTALDSAKSAADAAIAKLMDVIKSGGDGFTVDEQLEISEAASRKTGLPSKVPALESALANLQREAKMSTLTPVVDKARAAFKKVLEDAGMADLMESAGAGTSTVLTATVMRDPSDPTKWMPWVVASKFVNVAAPKPSKPSDSNPATEERGSKFFTVNGVEYTSKGLLEAFAQQKIDDGTLKWTGNFLDSVGLSHRADTLAEKLGATVGKR